MPIINKTKNTAAIYNRGREVVKVYDHGKLAWQKGGIIPNDYTPCDYIYNSSQSGGGVDLGFKFRLLDYSVEAKFKQDDISTWAAEESTDRLFIFGRSQSQNTYKGRIYYLKVWNTATEEVICNLIPCSRNSDGAAGFWDTAQKRFFTSTYWTAHNDNE